MLLLTDTVIVKECASFSMPCLRRFDSSFSESRVIETCQLYALTRLFQRLSGEPLVSRAGVFQKFVKA